MSKCRSLLLVLAISSLTGHAACSKPVETVSSVVAWKMQWIHELMETDWLTTTIQLRDGEGLASALVDAKIWLAQVRGHPGHVFQGKTWHAVKKALLVDEVSYSLGEE
jgi:hypothetical protein